MSARPRSRTAAVMRKELVQILRDPRSLAVALLMPVMMLIIYGYGISSDISEIKLGVVDWSRTQESRDLVRAFTESGYFRTVLNTDRYADLGMALDGRTIRVGLVIPADFARSIQRGAPASVQALVDGTEANTATVATGYMDAILRTYSTRVMLGIAQRKGLGARPRGAPPLELRTRVWYNPELKSVYFIVPGLIAVILMATSALLTSGSVARERERGTAEQLIASPLASRELMLGKVAAYTLISLVDVVIVVLVGTLWFRVPLRGSLMSLAITSGIFLMSSLGIGLLISAVMPSQQTAMIAAIMVTLLPSVLLSGFFFPIASMPAPVQLITYLVPARYFVVIMRGIFLKGSGVAVLWGQVVPMTLLGIALISASIFSFRKRL